MIAYDRDLKRKLAHGNAADDRQPDRSDQRHGAIQGGIRERRSVALPESVRECASAASTPSARSLIIPTAAIQHSPASAFVYLVKDDNSVEVAAM